jgi:hypothetical protein
MRLTFAFGIERAPVPRDEPHPLVNCGYTHVLFPATSMGARISPDEEREDEDEGEEFDNDEPRQIRGIAAVNERCRRSLVAVDNPTTSPPSCRPRPRKSRRGSAHHTRRIGTDGYPTQGDLAEHRRMKRMAKRSKAIAVYARATSTSRHARVRSFFEHFPEAAHIRFA